MTQLIQEKKKSLNENSLSDYWETDLIYTGSFPSTLPLPEFQRLQVKALLTGKGYKTVVPLREDCQDDLQWWSDQMSNWNGHSIITCPILDNNDRCITKGLGVVCQGRHTGRIQFSSHIKCFGAESSSFCCEGPHSQSKVASCSTENGQDLLLSLQCFENQTKAKTSIMNFFFSC